MSMQTSSDLFTPILSRSAGYPLTAKVALVTLHCHIFFCFLFLCNIIKFICLICFLIDFFYPCVHSDACAVCNRMAITTPKKPKDVHSQMDVLTGPG